MSEFAVRKMTSVLRTEADDRSTLAFPALRWMLSTYLTAKSVLVAALRRERVEFKKATFLQSKTMRRAHKEQQSVNDALFRSSSQRLDPQWRIRIESILNQPKFKELVQALGHLKDDFVNVLASAYGEWVGSYISSQKRKKSTRLTSEHIEGLCTKEDVQECERNYGLWGSLHIHEKESQLAHSIGKRRMQAPYLFKYWDKKDPPSKAKVALGDFDEIESYKHSTGKTTNVAVFGNIQASIAILLNKYMQQLQDEAEGADVTPGQKFQIMKYIYIHIHELLEENLPGAQSSLPSLSSSLRSAGFNVLVQVSPPLGVSPEEADSRYRELEATADLLYRDLEGPIQSINARTLYSFEMLLGTRNMHLPFVAHMMRSNPLASAAGYQISAQDHRVRRICKGSFCPAPGVIWNHMYITLMVLLQFLERTDMARELIVSDNFAAITGQERGDVSHHTAEFLASLYTEYIRFLICFPRSHFASCMQCVCDRLWCPTRKH